MRDRKVVVVGAGDVGAAFAYALLQSGLAQEIVVLDRNMDLAQGQVLDLAHGLPFAAPVQVRAGKPADYADATLIVITAGARQRPDETRLQLLGRNAGIIREIMTDIVDQDSQAVVVVVTNPVDVLTHVALTTSGFPPGRVIGSGTVLDSARFRYLIGQHCNIDVRNVHAYILGEHGDSELAAWSMTHIAGMPIGEYCAICGQCDGWQAVRDEVLEQVRKSAYHIIGYKGSTCYAIGLALVRIVGAVLRNERSVLTVSTWLDGEFGLRDVCLSVPCVVAEHGIDRVIGRELSGVEQTALQESAAVIRRSIESLDQAMKNDE